MYPLLHLRNRTFATPVMAPKKIALKKLYNTFFISRKWTIKARNPTHPHYSHTPPHTTHQYGAGERDVGQSPGRRAQEVPPTITRQSIQVKENSTIKTLYNVDTQSVRVCVCVCVWVGVGVCVCVCGCVCVCTNLHKVVTGYSRQSSRVLRAAIVEGPTLLINITTPLLS